MIGLWLVLVGCSTHRIDVHIDPGQGSVEQIAEVLHKRMKSVGARKFRVSAGDDVQVSLRPDDVERLDAVLVSGRLSLAWPDEPPFLDDIVPRHLTCLQTASGVMWALSLRGDDGLTLHEQTLEHLDDTLVIAVDGVTVSLPRVELPITGGTAMVALDSSYRDCRVLSARIVGGPLPAGVQRR